MVRERRAARFDGALPLRPIDLDGLTADELLAHYKAVRERLTKGRPRVLEPRAPDTASPEPFLVPPIPVVPERPPNIRNARHIVEPILEARGVTWAEIILDRRWRPLIIARREIYTALRQAGWSFQAIGSYVHRDHSTVIYAIETLREEKARHD
jgi:hypothetical protein